MLEKTYRGVDPCVTITAPPPHYRAAIVSEEERLATFRQSFDTAKGVVPDIRNYLNDRLYRKCDDGVGA